MLRSRLAIAAVVALTLGLGTACSHQSGTTDTQAGAVASPNTCSAAVDNPTPARYSTVRVLVGSHLANASVTTVAHYRTTNTTRFGTTDGAGRTGIAYWISGATSGYPVEVDVNVAGQETCSTQFTPR